MKRGREKCRPYPSVHATARERPVITTNSSGRVRRASTMTPGAFSVSTGFHPRPPCRSSAPSSSPPFSYTNLFIYFYFFLGVSILILLHEIPIMPRAHHYSMTNARRGSCPRARGLKSLGTLVYTSSQGEALPDGYLRPANPGPSVRMRRYASVRFPRGSGFRSRRSIPRTQESSELSRRAGNNL